MNDIKPTRSYSNGEITVEWRPELGMTARTIDAYPGVEWSDTPIVFDNQPGDEDADK